MRLLTIAEYLKKLPQIGSFVMFQLLHEFNLGTTKMTLPTVGQAAPDFTLLNQNEEQVSLSQHKGSWVVLYFYPRAMTPGCTVQACSLRDSQSELEANNIVVLGVSPDKPASLKKFEAKESLNFTLLADTEQEAANAYGAWQEKSMYGKKYMGMVRMTLIIDPQGNVAHVMPKVKTKTHHDDVLSWITQSAEKAA